LLSGSLGAGFELHRVGNSEILVKSRRGGIEDEPTIGAPPEVTLDLTFHARRELPL